MQQIPLPGSSVVRDLVIKMPEKPGPGITLYLLERASDGFIIGARTKTLNVVFSAKKLMTYVADWRDWDWADFETVAQIREVILRMDQDKKKEKEAKP